MSKDEVFISLWLKIQAFLNWSLPKIEAFLKRLLVEVKAILLTLLWPLAKLVLILIFNATFGVEKDDSYMQIDRWFLRCRLTKVSMDRLNRMLRIGAGYNNGNPFFRIDLWSFGIRLTR